MAQAPILTWSRWWQLLRVPVRGGRDGEGCGGREEGGVLRTWLLWSGHYGGHWVNPTRRMKWGINGAQIAGRPCPGEYEGSLVRDPHPQTSLPFPLSPGEGGSLIQLCPGCGGQPPHPTTSSGESPCVPCIILVFSGTAGSPLQPPKCLRGLWGKPPALPVQGPRRIHQLGPGPVFVTRWSQD